MCDISKDASRLSTSDMPLLHQVRYLRVSYVGRWSLSTATRRHMTLQTTNIIKRYKGSDVVAYRYMDHLPSKYAELADRRPAALLALDEITLLSDQVRIMSSIRPILTCLVNAYMATGSEHARLG